MSGFESVSMQTFDSAICTEIERVSKHSNTFTSSSILFEKVSRLKIMTWSCAERDLKNPLNSFRSSSSSVGSEFFDFCCVDC